MRGGRPDWYRVAEYLAALAIPELLQEDEAMTRGAGRPKNTGEDFLAMEVHRVMTAFNVGVAEACRRISRGDRVPLLTAPWKVSKDGTAARMKGRFMTKGSPWKGINPTTLESRYWRWRKAEKEQEQKLTVEIR